MELHLCISIAKTRKEVELLLQKYHLWNELRFTESEYLPNFELKYTLLGNLRKQLTLKSTTFTLTLKGFSFLPKQKYKTFSFAKAALAMQFGKIHSPTSEFCVKFHFKKWFRNHRLGPCAISVFRVKFKWNLLVRQWIFYSISVVRVKYSTVLYLLKRSFFFSCNK